MTKDRSFAVVFLVGLAALLWYLSSVVGDMQSFNDWDKPAEVAKLIKAFAAMVAAMLAALGVNVRDLIGSFTASTPLDAANKVKTP